MAEKRVVLEGTVCHGWLLGWTGLASLVAPAKDV
jgi:hypothetical protein